MKTKLIAFAVLAVPILAAPALAGDRIVHCYVDPGQGAEFRGPCLFTPLRGGSFTLEHRNPNRLLNGYISRIDVDIVAPNVAVVTVLTSDGKYHWGQARRSTRDPACWVGLAFTICARG